jgi:hypothetical protein
VKEEDLSESIGIPFEQLSRKEWVTWISIHVRETGRGQVKIAYLSKIKPLPRRKVEGGDLLFNILLLVFTLPVGHPDANLELYSSMYLTLITGIYLFLTCSHL